VVPCCGPGQELGPIAALFPEGGRQVIGVGELVRCIRYPSVTQPKIVSSLTCTVNLLPPTWWSNADLAPGMVEIATQRAQEAGEHVSAVVGDAMVPPPGAHAAFLSVFGLQQLPDPVAALGAWVGALAPGGVAVIIYWPMGSGVETKGPWAHWGQLLKSKLGAAARRGTAGWEDALAGAATAAGGTVLENCSIAHEIKWLTPAVMWEGMTRAGPWHAQRLRRGDAFVDGLREEFCAAFPADEPITHTPSARLLVVKRNGT
jgi:SAM-dependent methyltransferase